MTPAPHELRLLCARHMLAAGRGSCSCDLHRQRGCPYHDPAGQLLEQTGSHELFEEEPAAVARHAEERL